MYSKGNLAVVYIFGDTLTMTEVKQLIENWLLTHPNASIEDAYMAGYNAGLYEGYEKCQNDVSKAMGVKDIRVKG